MKNFKKLSAIFLSMLLLLSAVFVPMTVQTVSAATYKPTDSLILGQTATYSIHSSGFTYATSDNATMKITTDGDTAVAAQFRDGASGQNIVWMFNNYARVDAFELWAHKNATLDFGFELYIGTDSANLFDSTNLAYTHIRDEANVAQGHYAITLDEPVEGAIVGMKITDTGGSSSIAIYEFALYGQVVKEEYATFYANRYVLMRNLANGGAESLIAGDLPYSATVGNTTTNASGSEYGTTSGQTRFTALTDANYEANHTNKTDIGGAVYGDANKGWYQFTYKLDSLTDITGAAVYSGYNNDDRGYNWELYVGTDPSTLYNGEPVASGRSYKSDGYIYGTRVLLSNTGNYVGNYVGFKLIPENTLNDSCVRLAELQVFGEGNQSGATARWATAADATTESLLYGRGLENTVVDSTALGGTWAFANTKNTYTYLQNPTRLTDGVVSTAHSDVTNGTNAKLIWMLEETTDIESFLLYNSSNQYYNAAYEVYASDSLATLFDADNCIYTYTFKDENGNIDPDEMTYGGKYVEFHGDAVKSANYVAVWLREGLRASKTTDSATGAVSYTALDTGFRISEIAFFGTKTENGKKNGKMYSATRTTETTFANISAQLGDASFTAENNLLKAENLTVKNASGATTTLSASNIAKLTNGTLASEEFYGSYLNYEFTYFLGGLTEVTGFMHVRNNTGFTEGYKVYVGSSMDSLYSEENLVLDMSAFNSMPRVISTSVKFGTPRTGIYLGIKWTGVTSNSEVRIAEIAAWGNQEDTGYTLSPNIGSMASADSAKSNASDVNLLAGLSATTGYYGSTLSSTGLYCVQGITDGKANQHYDFNYTAADEGPGSELLYDLGYVSTINEFAFWMTCANRQFSYEVYMGADYDTMFEKPVAVWDYNLLPDSLGQKFKFDEPKSARYIAIRLTDTRYGPNTDSYRVSEVAAFGTLGGVDAEFVEIGGAEISSDGKNVSYNATYYFPAGIMTETVTDIGTVVYPTTALAGADLTLDTVGASKTSAVLDEVMDIVNAYDEAGYKGIRANSTFAGADTVGATTKLTARAYITLSNGKTYYSAPYSYSVTQIKRLAAKKYMDKFENDTDYIANKGYNGDIDTVWATLVAAKSGVSADKWDALNGATNWLENVKSTCGLKQEWLDNGLTTLGDTSRLAAVIRKLMRGEDITLVQLGGSITEGYHATDKYGQAEIVAEFLNAAFPGQVTLKNAGIAATGATFGAYRLEQDVLVHNPDLVIVEYAINDARDDVAAMGAYENIIRRLLSEDIAVIALHNLVYYAGGNIYFAEGSATSHQNIGYVYDIPQVRAFNAYYMVDGIYGQGSDMYYNTGDGTHPNDRGHHASAALVANLIYNVMMDIENQPTESALIPTAPMTRFGGYINDTAAIYKAQDIEAGNTPVDISGAAYVTTGNKVGNNDIRGNHSYDIYTIASGDTATIAVNNATDVLPLVAATASGGKASTFVVTDAEGNVLNEGTFSSYYTGSLTTESARIIEGARFYNGEATDITITITAVDGPIQLAGVLACVADGWETPELPELPIMAYDLEQYTAPIWEGNTVYHESVLFIENEDGTVTAPALIYTPDLILSVASADLKTTYTLGKDFTVEGNKIVLTEDTSIPVMPYESYISNGAVIKTTSVMEYQLSVSYTHADAWTLSTPAAQLADLPKLKAKLEAGEAVNMLFCGDSITVGYEGSGFHDVAPYMPGWVDMVEASLEAKYSSDITVNNVAVGGTTTGHGLTQHILNVTADTDVVFIAYGMNMSDNTANYDDHIRQMIDYARGVNADAEIVLVSSMTANEHESVKPGNVLDAQEDVLDAIATDYTGVAVAPVNTVFENVQTIKRYEDITGNGYNHPNDFGIRLYAQTVLAVLS